VAGSESKLARLLRISGTRGLYMPLAWDGDKKPASARLLFAHISFWVAVISVVALHFWSSILPATTTAILFFMLCTILYMLKNLTKAKVDLDDKSIDLEADAEPKESKESP